MLVISTKKTLSSPFSILKGKSSNLCEWYHVHYVVKKQFLKNSD